MTSISISFCESCGFKISERSKLCPYCGKLPLCDDRYKLFISDKDLDAGEWNEEFVTEYMKWLDETSPKFCKECGMLLDDIADTNDVIAVDKKTGNLIYGDNHPCNPDSPFYE